MPTVLWVGAAGVTALRLGLEVTAISPGLMGSDTTVGCCLVDDEFIAHRCPVPFWPSNGRLVRTTGGRRLGSLVGATEASDDAFVAVCVEVGTSASGGQRIERKLWLITRHRISEQKNLGNNKKMERKCKWAIYIYL